MRPMTRNLLISWGVVLAIAAGSALPLCGWMFACGCTLRTGARYCNIHNPEGPHCPWCSSRTALVLSFAAGLGGAGLSSYGALRIIRPTALAGSLAGVVGFLLWVSAAGLAVALWLGYPTWFGLRLPAGG